MAYAVLKFAGSTFTTSKPARLGASVALLLLAGVVAFLAGGCASISRPPELVIETAEPAPGDAAFGRYFALRRMRADHAAGAQPVRTEAPASPVARRQAD